MATPEIAAIPSETYYEETQTPQYRRANPFKYKFVRTSQAQEKAEQLDEDYHLSRIIGGLAIYAPRQEGVLRYPPIAIGVLKRSVKVKEYIGMEPVPSWEEAFHKKNKTRMQKIMSRLKRH